MAYDVEGLEILAEFLQLQYGHGEQELVVLASVHRGRNRIQVHFLAYGEAAALERDLVGIDLGAKAARPRNAENGVRKALGHENAGRRVDLTVLQLAHGACPEFGTQVCTNEHAVFLQPVLLSGALLAGPLQRNWLVALSSAAHDTPFSLTERVYARGKNDRRIADEKNRYRDTQIRQVLKLTAAVLLARRDAGRTSGPVLLSRAAISNWLGAAMSEKSRSKPGPLKKYYWDDPKTRQPLFPESSPNSDLTLTDLHAAWEAQWGWRVYTEAELISAVKEGSVPKDALCFKDEDTDFAPEALITARAGEIAAKEGENTHEGES